jgi:hypothetical protein
MWLVVGEDEEHRFPEWAEAVAYYRSMVDGWVGAHGDPGGGVKTAVAELPVGGSHEAVFPSPDGGRAVEFRIGWEVPQVGLDHFTAC